MKLPGGENSVGVKRQAGGRPAVQFARRAARKRRATTVGLWHQERMHRVIHEGNLVRPCIMLGAYKNKSIFFNHRCLLLQVDVQLDGSFIEIGTGA